MAQCPAGDDLGYLYQPGQLSGDLRRYGGRAYSLHERWVDLGQGIAFRCDLLNRV